MKGFKYILRVGTDNYGVITTFNDVMESHGASALDESGAVLIDDEDYDKIKDIIDTVILNALKDEVYENNEHSNRDVVEEEADSIEIEVFKMIRKVPKGELNTFNSASAKDL